jgi:exodeoxyribonuclease VII large subunit
MQEQAERLDRLASRLRETALRQVAFRREQLSTVTYRLSAAVRNYVAERRHRLDLIEQTVRLHSPEAIFRRGYSLTLKDGKPVHSAAELHSGDTLQTLFASGEASSRVEKCEE